RGKGGVTPAKKTMVCQRNGTGFGRDHRCAMAFAENCGLFEVLACSCELARTAPVASEQRLRFASAGGQVCP
ncbi:MAG: hypothetical protein PHW25_21025, partial [Zoogloea sp.]|uniref:hypothetical protein n=1 Tax=Zoogloea sp. TaxID=49181 RepID=UPI0026318CF8